jgi:hypothetical protein
MPLSLRDVAPDTGVRRGRSNPILIVLARPAATILLPN